MQVVRNFVKRETEKSNWSGDIGRIVLETDATVIKLNGKPVPLGSMEYLLTFALQAFQDAYAGAQNLEDATAAFDKKVAACIEGTIGVRTGGVDEATKVARSVVRTILAKSWTKEQMDEVTDARLDEIFEKNKAKLQAAVDEQVEALRIARERRAALARKADELEL